MSRIYTPGATGNTQYVSQGRFDPANHDFTSMSNPFFRASTTSISSTRPASVPMRDVDVASRDSLQRVRGAQRASEAWAERSWLHDRRPLAAGAGNAAVQQCEMDPKAAQAPVQSGKQTRSAVLLKDAVSAGETLDASVVKWINAPSWLPQDEFVATVQGQCKALQCSKEALAYYRRNHQFSLKYHRAAAKLKKIQRDSEVNIIKKLTDGKLEPLSLEQKASIIFNSRLSPEDRLAIIEANSPINKLDAILTQEWREASPGFAALAKKVTQVRNGLVEIEKLYNKGTVIGLLKGVWKQAKLARQITSGVPPHFHKLVKTKLAAQII